MMSPAKFLRARIQEDYERERGNAEIDTAREVAARLRANVRLGSIGFAVSLASGRPVPYEVSEAARYSDHPDFDPSWSISRSGGGNPQ